MWWFITSQDLILACQGECKSECGLSRPLQCLRRARLPKAQQKIFAEASPLQNTCLCLAPLIELGQSHLSRALLVPTSEAWCDFHWRGSQNLQQQLEQAIKKTPNKMKYIMEEINRMSLCPNMTGEFLICSFSCSFPVLPTFATRISKYVPNSSVTV